jgi:DNA primase
MLAAHRAAAEFYREQLRMPRAEGPRGYLAHRGVGHVVEAERWTVGYTPRGWTSLVTHLVAAGFLPSELRAAGLAVTTRRGSLIDRFRDRLMFGIRNSQGSLVGFIGRAAPGAARDVPKYLNSPHSALYAKSENLFGIAEQRQQLAAGARPVIVEGALDVLAIDHLGTDVAAVSTCGTALRPGQAAALRSVTTSDTALVAFDGDDAGRKAAAHAYAELAPAFPRLLSVRPPAGDDPASLALRDPVGLTRLLQHPRSLADQLIDDVIEPWLPKRDNVEAVVAALHQATRLAAGFSLDDARRQVSRICDQLDMPVTTVADDLADAMCRVPSTARRDDAALHRSGRRAGPARQLGR